MFTVALDTATPAVGAAVGDVTDGAGRLLAERVQVAVNRHGELLAPLLAAALADAGVSTADVGAVVAGTGPGPFTGLRVGLMTATALADALGCPTYGVCSLDALAEQHGGGDLVAVTDARRREVYWARYRDGRRVDGPAVEAPAALAGRLRDAGDGARLVGAGALLHREAFAGLPLDEQAPYPSPAALLRLAAPRISAGAPGEPLTPLYLRRPDAVPPGPRKSVTPA